MPEPAIGSPEWAQQDRTLWVKIPVLVLGPLTIIFFAIRTWARHTMSGLGLEDWVLAAAFVFAIVTNALFLAMINSGFGFHADSLDPEDRSLTLRMFWVAQMTYKISLQATKVSLLLFYVRIFHHISWFKKVSYVFITFLLVYLFATTVVSLVQCQPIATAWDSSRTGKCIDLISFFVFNGSFAVVTDIIVLILPLPLVWGLQLPLGQKLALVPVFGIGIFIVTVSAVRLYALIATPPLDKTYDLEGTLWTIIEFNLAIVCASLPSVRILLAKVFPRIFRGSSLARYRSGEPRSGAVAAAGGSWGHKANVSAGWSRVHSGGRASISMSAVMSRRDETSSEEIILEHKGIKKTVQYDVEYGSAR
ncbi:hypothetical protein OQA88_10747 [Cercophora sp. LCS_1]